MDAAVYQRMADDEETHWWFRGRRAILDGLLSSLDLPKRGARLLEVGCGTGGNLTLLRRFGQLDALEFDPDARLVAARKGGIDVGYCELPSRIDAPDRAYDVVALFDVLEHIDDDRGALRGVAAKLKQGGHVVVTVPAYPWLWSAHDAVHHHFRRYTRATLREAIAASGLRLERIGAFNFLLLPAALAQRSVKRLLGRDTADDRMPSPAVNRILGGIFSLESHLVGRVPLPAGLSLYAIARRDDDEPTA